MVVLLLALLFAPATPMVTVSLEVGWERERGVAVNAVVVVLGEEDLGCELV